MCAAYEQAKQYDKAESWRRKWLAVVKQRAGANSPAYAGELAALGLNLLLQKKWTDAEPTLKECLLIRQKTQPDTWNTFNTMSMLGAALLKQKKHAEAEPLLVKGFEGMKHRVKTIPLPAGRSVVMLGFAGLNLALQAIPLALAHGPVSCDLLDRRLVSLAQMSAAETAPLLSDATEAVLLIDDSGSRTEQRLGSAALQTGSFEWRPHSHETEFEMRIPAAGGREYAESVHVIEPRQ